MLDLGSGSAGLGVGVGLRPVHYGEILAQRPAVPWFEAISENYMGLRGHDLGGRPLEVLERLRRDYPIFLHGVSMNVGSADSLDEGYLARLRLLVDRVDPIAVSDHLCWTGQGGENLHDLLPLPYTRDAIEHVVARVCRAQDVLGRRILLENVSSYLTFAHSEMTEWEFLTEVSSRADCGILLDVNNVYVSAVNHGFDARRYLRAIPAERIGQIHLAGHSRAGALLIDTHDHPVPAPVWDLYEEALGLLGPVPTLIEWDDRIPPLTRLLAEAAKARRFWHANRPSAAAAA